MESLEGGVIFIGNPSFGVLAGEHTKMVANRVYYFSSHTYIPTPSFIVYGRHRQVTRETSPSFLINMKCIMSPALGKLGGAWVWIRDVEAGCGWNLLY